MSKLSFSLIELILVVVLMGVISFLAVSLPKYHSDNSLENIREKLYPNGEVILSCLDGEIFYIFDNFEPHQIDKIKYSVHKGVGDSFILYCNNNYYVFKPFKITKVSNFNKAKQLFLNKEYLDEKVFYTN